MNATQQRFEGAVNTEEACRLLGGISRSNLWRLWKTGKVRKSNVSPGRVAYTVESIREHLREKEA